MHARRATQLPQSGVGLVVESRRVIAEPLQAGEQVGVTTAGAARTRIVEQRPGREHSFTIQIVLRLFARLVADSYRPHSPVPGETIRDVLGGDLPAINVVDGDEPRVIGRFRDAKQKCEKALDGAQPRCWEPPERKS